MNLPTGTVTLLFTDIAGSTRLWQEHPKTMPTTLARHDTLLRKAIEQNNGRVVKTVGDAFMAVFATAHEAVHAALQAQISLCAEPWPQETPIHVRMGLHTGATEERDNDYYGHEVNRAARIQGVVQAGQIVLSQATSTLVAGRLPEQATLIDLGLHQLKDLREPENLWQLCHPGLPDTFAPLNSLTHWPNNLPRQLSSFVGREQQIEEVKSLLSQGSCLTLVGSGGCGKTRLALQVAAEVLPDYPHGVWLVELAALTEPSLVVQALATTLGLREEAGRTLTQTLVEHARSRALLLLLDNCEHLLDACAQVAHVLLRACPNVKLLATSREALNLGGEQTYLVPSLSLPDPAQPQTPQTLLQYEACRLFVERAVLVKADFVVTEETAWALAQICQRLDGIPLAIELAASRIRALSLEDIHSRLDQRFRLLTGGSRATLPRQQTLRALIDWSYELLKPEEKRLLCRLSVFAGGWTLEAAERVGVSEEMQEWEALDLLSSLVDKSLVVTEAVQGQTRYRLLETVRQYGQELLREAGEWEAVKIRHIDFFLTFAEHADSQLSLPDQVEWLHKMERDHDNLRAALQFCAEAGGAGENALFFTRSRLRLVFALGTYWDNRGYWSEGRIQAADALADPGARDPVLRAGALGTAGHLAQRQGDYAAARCAQEERLAIGRVLDDKSLIATALRNLGTVACDQGEFIKARPYFEESLEIARAAQDKRGIAADLTNLATVLQPMGDYEAASQLLLESLAVFRELGDKATIGVVLNNLGNTAYLQGNHTAAQSYFEESLAIRRELGNKRGIANSLANLSNVALEQKDYATAQRLQEESLAIRRELGATQMIGYTLHNLARIAFLQRDYTATRTLNRQSLAILWEVMDRYALAAGLEAFAGLALAQGEAVWAARWTAAAEGTREAIGTPHPPIAKEENDRLVQSIRAALGDEAFETAWKEGRALSLEEAVESALA